MTPEDLLANFEVLEAWEDRYRLLIDLGRKLPALPEGTQTEANKVRGCMSQVWLVHETHPDRTFTLFADSDAMIVKGLIAVILMAYSGKKPDAILSYDISELFTRLGLEQHLSPNRRNGFFAIVGRIQELARTANAA